MSLKCQIVIKASKCLLSFSYLTVDWKQIAHKPLPSAGHTEQDSQLSST